MLKISKLGDYAVVILLDLCDAPDGERQSARRISERIHLPQTTVSKVLKGLLRAELVVAHRGLCGGYSLAETPQQISLLRIIESMDGPLSLTTCSVPSSIDCQTHATCSAGPHWPIINQALTDVLAGISLSQLHQSPSPSTVFSGHRSAHEPQGVSHVERRS